MVHLIASVKASTQALPAAATRIASARRAAADTWRAALANPTGSTGVQKLPEPTPASAAPPTTGPPTAPAAPAAPGGLAALFPGNLSCWVVNPPPAPVPVPTAASVFGPNVFLDNPTETLPGGRSLNLNPLWFATPATAAKIAQMLGGKVVESNDFTSAASPVQQQQPNELVELPDGRRFNAGWIASLYTHGFTQSYIDQTIGEMVGQGKTTA